jgi:hypothetical protein
MITTWKEERKEELQKTEELIDRLRREDQVEHLDSI